MGKLQEATARFRSGVLSRERAAGNTLATEYTQVYRRLLFDFADVTRMIEQARRDGKELSPSWLYRQERYRLLALQVRAEVERFADFASEEIARAQRESVLQASRDAQEAIRLAPGTLDRGIEIPANFTRFNPEVVEGMIGRTSAGSPLRSLLGTLVGESLEAVTTAFVTGIVKGENPRIVGRRLKQEFAIPGKRAVTIARTEILGAYRETSIRTYEQNSDIVKGWKWRTARNLRTCAMCLAMDGRFFPVTTPFGSHPNCRCNPEPVTKTWEEMGFPQIKSRRKEEETASQWFEKLPESKKRVILGKTKYQRYSEGSLTLEDLIGYREDEQWGPNRWERSLKQIDAGKYRPPKVALGGEVPTG